VRSAPRNFSKSRGKNSLFCHSRASGNPESATKAASSGPPL
jgi:hypothetical protein